MALPNRKFALGRREEQGGEREELLRALARTRVQINQAYNGFNQSRDGDLIESYVFEINALQSRYNYLLRRVKELESAT